MALKSHPVRFSRIHVGDDPILIVCAWYRNNEWWWRAIKDNDAGYKAYYQAQYAGR